MTPKDLTVAAAVVSALQEAEALATPAPWEHESLVHDGDRGTEHWVNVPGKNHVFLDCNGKDGEPQEWNMNDYRDPGHNAELMAKGRNALPALLRLAAATLQHREVTKNHAETLEWLHRLGVASVNLDAAIAALAAGEMK